MITVQVIFWTMTQPVNSFWLKETELSRSGTRFFQTRQGRVPRDWTVARDQWERSHILRAIAASLGLFLLDGSDRALKLDVKASTASSPLHRWTMGPL
jgi:hypothetical protein